MLQKVEFSVPRAFFQAVVTIYPDFHQLQNRFLIDATLVAFPLKNPNYKDDGYQL
jgi:hypothetical protein